MSKRKTVITVPEDLLREVERFALAMRTSPSCLFTKAARAYLATRGKQELAERIKRECANYKPTPEERAFTRMAAEQLAKFTENDKW
jgi:metal-responsive CopG/Arc/MetJ family transcriptional regulator